jgi:2-polyprenyl-6-hydroxyphenyl methylase/3-demethylubiquinone-9 3-methyltransferase
MTTASKPSTIDTEEVAQFAAIAAEWWDERGKFAPLHRMNPTRIAYIRERIEVHFGKLIGGSGASATPFKNLTLLDVGCGGGLICEPMARLGAQVTGLDAAPENTAIAQSHAETMGLSIAYQASTAEALADSGAQFDVVLALEIVEHVADPALFYDALAALVKPGGLLIMSTMNRTAKAYALAIVGAEYILRWLPRGTHDWNKFIKPSEMADALAKRGLTPDAPMGLIFHPLSGRFRLNSNDLDVNYLLCAQKSA